MTREERRAQLERISRGKNGMLTLQRLRQIATGKAGSTPIVRPNDSLEKMIQEILDNEFPEEQPAP